MGFQNEKDHPEVAPRSSNQLQLRRVVAAADHIQLYKLICRRWRAYGLDRMLPAEPVVGVNGSACIPMFHQQGRQESVLDPKGEEQLSKAGWNLSIAF